MASLNSYSTFGKQTLIYALGVILSRAASFLMLPIYTRYLTPADYGILELLEMSVNVIAIFTGVAVSASFFKFYSDYAAFNNKKLVVSTSLLTLILMSFFFLIICWPLSSKFSLLALGSLKYGSFVKIALVTFVLQSFVEIPMLYLRAEGKAGLFVSYDLIKLLMQISMCIYFVVFMGKGVLGVLYSNLFAHIILSTMVIFPIRRIPWAFSFELSLAILVFGAPLILNSFGHFILTFSDRYFLSSLKGVTDVGIYSLAYKFGFLLSIMVYYPFSQVWEAKRFDIAKNESYQKYFYQAFFLLNSLVIFCAFCISVFSREVILIMSSVSFHTAYRIVPIIVSAYIFQIWTSFCDIGLYMKHKTMHLGLATGFSAAIVILLNILLIPRYGAFGAAYATLIVFSTRFAIIYYFSQRAFPITYGWGRTMGLSAMGIALFLLSRSLPQTDIIARLILNGGLSMVFIIVVWIFFFRKEEQEIVAGLVASFYRSARNSIVTGTAR